MGYFQVRYDSRVIIYEHRAFIRLATGHIFRRASLPPLSVELSANSIDLRRDPVLILR